jgi:hypothetical protein
MDISTTKLAREYAEKIFMYALDWKQGRPKWDAELVTMLIAACAADCCSQLGHEKSTEEDYAADR